MHTQTKHCYMKTEGEKNMSLLNISSVNSATFLDQCMVMTQPSPFFSNDIYHHLTKFGVYFPCHSTLGQHAMWKYEGGTAGQTEPLGISGFLSRCCCLPVSLRREQLSGGGCGDRQSLQDNTIRLQIYAMFSSERG